MDKRIDKLTDQLQLMIQNFFHECEDRLLNDIDKRLNLTRNDLNNITERVESLESLVHEIKNTATDKIVELTNETEELKREISYLKDCARKHDNSIVAYDIRINGIPEHNNEDLFDMYLKICQIVNICPPDIKAIFRVKIKSPFGRLNHNLENKRANSDAPIIIKFKSPYERNFVLKSITY
ncbi:hypothetical protein FF38_00950 [Lucilia cuprina]|uniref:Uncharacterized protein n=1 Tax=Lucilia cuprina TaxID=7375 RepID=A0A0L0C2I4_LUCCU|nr:hypothetical protein FF38_00950 [Lucilia cuprina]